MKPELQVGAVGSAIYTGTVSHRRYDPRPHRFRYGVYYFLLNLDELEACAGHVPLIGINRRGLTSFYDVDHLGATATPVREKLEAWLRARGRELPGGPVLLLTNLRVLGYVFNPVSYYYCLNPKGEIELVVAEVNNTFGETYCYLLDQLRERGPHAVSQRCDKSLHVSPFIEIDDIEYDWVFTAPGPDLSVHINEFRGGSKFFDATLRLKRRPLTTASLLGVMVRHPHVTAHTIARIHWQALRLWWKGAPFHRKPVPPISGLPVSEEVP